MNYHILGNTGIKVSEIGYGGEYLEGKDAAIVVKSIQKALDAGVNIIDIFMSEPNVRTNIGRAIAGRRDQVIIQGHFRAIWKNNQYARTLNIDEVKFFFEDLLHRLNTDYIDIGMLHMIDNFDDYKAVFEGEIYQYALSLKEKGVIRHIGLSSHNPKVAKKAVDEGLIDVLLFSLNPAYDLIEDDGENGPLMVKNDLFAGDSFYTMNKDRSELYRACEEKGVGITVMKSLAAGVLLDETRSPFGKALTVPQCIHYALTRPAVASVLVGMQTPEEVEEALRYETMPEEEKNYTAVLAGTPKFSLNGHCMYCNHCLPCPSHIDIAQVNKYLDMVLAEGKLSPTVAEHYKSLTKTAGDCIQCGACEKRCPFAVPIVERMKQAVSFFGK